MTGFRLMGAMAALAAGLLLGPGAGAQTPPQHAAQAVQAGPESGAAAPAERISLQPRAIELLQAMCERLAKAKSMSFTADVSYEYPSKLGPPVVYAMRYEAVMKRPDKLRVIMPGDGPVSEFYYDGKQMMAYAPAENLVAGESAPPTLDAALKQAFERADLYFPFTDLIVDDPYAALTRDAKLAFVTGPSGVLDGVKTTGVVLADDDVFLQIWIGTGDMLPRRIRAIYSGDPLQLRHDMALSNWRINPSAPAGLFNSKKARQANPIAFARPNMPPVPDAGTPKTINAQDSGAPGAPTSTQ